MNLACYTSEVRKKKANIVYQCIYVESENDTHRRLQRRNGGAEFTLRLPPAYDSVASPRVFRAHVPACVSTHLITLPWRRQVASSAPAWQGL